MKPARSYTIVTEPGKRPIEADAFTCRHCNAMVRVPKAEDAKQLKTPADIGGYCPTCDANICGPCCDEMARILKCVCFERRLVAMEQRGRLLKAVLDEGVRPATVNQC